MSKDVGGVTSALATYEALLATLKDAVDKLAALDKEISTATNLLSAANNKKDELGKALVAEKKKTAELLKAKGDADTQKDMDEKAYTTSKALTITLNENYTRLLGELTPLTTELEKSTNALNDVTTRLTTLEGKTNTINTKYTNSKTSLEAVITAFSTKEKALELFNAKIQELTNSIEVKKATLDSTTNNPPTSILEKTQDKIAESIATYKTNLNQADLKIKDINQKIEKLRTNIISISKEIAASSKEISLSETVVA